MNNKSYKFIVQSDDVLHLKLRITLKEADLR